MPLSYYSGDSDNWADDPRDLPLPPVERLTDPRGYLPDPGLVQAANVAILLGQPLLLTGEPGTGKTQFAYNLAAELGLGEPLRFDVKSTTVHQDLYYSFDAVRHFRDARQGERLNATDYVKFNALGLAVMRANRADTVADLWPAGEGAFEGPVRSVVLIDEIDKAPRDLPNDLLNEIERCEFTLQEAANRRVDADPAFRPVVVITSNSERHLPAPFLRRCVYYDIPFPDDEALTRIVGERLGGMPPDAPLLGDALDLFRQLRAPAAALGKPPGTSELINLLFVLGEAGLGADEELRRHPSVLAASLSTVIKNREDLGNARRVVDAFAAS